MWQTVRRINIEILGVKGLIWILASWKNQSESWRSPGNLFLKKGTNSDELFHIYSTSFHSSREDKNSINWPRSQCVASHRYRGGHRFESRWSPDFFRLLLSDWKIYCDDHSSLSSTTAVQIWIISYILHIITHRLSVNGTNNAGQILSRQGKYKSKTNELERIECRYNVALLSNILQTSDNYEHWYTNWTFTTSISIKGS